MSNLPFDVVIKIMSYLPVITYERCKINREVIERFYKKKWLNKYQLIQEYSEDPTADDYYKNWLENDIIAALNDTVPLCSGLTDTFRSILKRMYFRCINNMDEFDEVDMDDSSTNIDRYFGVLNKDEIIELDRRLTVYNTRMELGQLAYPMFSNN